ncbi:hypothetical protein [Burkholderia glumae]|uniref:hypothetical protein n=1 Tax=Burkholderia glumae TaxID=337 RepID=UPI002164BA1A|nr:hypothetical protein [Burkholderia glumae]UVT00185.1 hypothetical protein EFP19_31545 [Burkholderia glumae]
MPATGEIVSFTFTTPGRSSGVRQKHYAWGEVVKAGEKSISVRVLDDPTQHDWWRETHVGKIKVISLGAVIPELQD